MFSSRLRLVPWRNKQEWESVYKNAFSDDRELTRMACDVMEVWLCLRNDAPPAVECTYSLIQVLQRDKELDTSNNSEIGLMFSTTILRVVNLATDGGRRNTGESLYRLAGAANLPDWIVSLRHDIAHGGALPDTSTLRMAANYLLQWIKTYYWEVVSQEYEDVILSESSEEVFQRNITYFVRLYIEASSSKSNLLLNLDELETYSLQSAWYSVAPWLPAPKYTIPGCISRHKEIILAYLLPYLNPSHSLGVDGFSVLLPELYSHYEENNGLVTETWSDLVNALNQQKALGKLLIALCQDSMTSARDNWIKTVALAVAARHKFEESKSAAAVSHLFEGPEAAVSERILLRKRLNLQPDSSVLEVTNELYRRIEKRNVDLQGVIRLIDDVEYLSENCCIVDSLQILASQPYPGIYPLLDILFSLVEPEIGEKLQRQVKTLIGIFLGERGLQSCNKGKIFSISDFNLTMDEDGSEPESGVDSNAYDVNPILEQLNDGDGHFVDSTSGDPVFYRCSIPSNVWLENCETLTIERCKNPSPCKFIFPVT